MNPLFETTVRLFALLSMPTEYTNEQKREIMDNAAEIIRQNSPHQEIVVDSQAKVG